MSVIKGSETEKLFREAFEDVLKVMEQGAAKYGADNWLSETAIKTSRKEMLKSMCSHAAEYFAGHTKDEETNLHPCLHGACRNIMAYILYTKGLQK